MTHTVTNPFFPENSLFDTNIRGVAYGDETFIAVGDGGGWAYSNDGRAWGNITPANPDVNPNPFKDTRINSVAYGDGRFVAVGEKGVMAYFAGGFWVRIPVNPLNRPFGADGINGVAYGGGRFVAAGNGGKMAYSAGSADYMPVRARLYI